MKQTITLVLSTLLYVLIGFFTCNTEALECLQCFYTSKDLISNHPDVANCLNNPNQTIGNEVTLQESVMKMIKNAQISKPMVEVSLPNCSSPATSCARYVGATKDWGRVMYRTCGTVDDQIGCHNLTVSNELIDFTFLHFYTLKKCVCNERNYCNDFIGFDGDDYVRKRRKNESIRHSIPHHVLILVEYLLLFYIIFLSQNQLESNY